MKVCRNCGAPFIPAPHPRVPTLPHPRQAYCSKKCTDAVAHKRNYKYILKSHTQFAKCPECDTSFLKTRANQIYCSSKCCWAKNARSRPKRPPQKRSSRIIAKWLRSIAISIPNGLEDKYAAAARRHFPQIVETLLRRHCLGS